MIQRCAAPSRLCAAVCALLAACDLAASVEVDAGGAADAVSDGPCAPGRRVLVGAAENARDLGGVPLPGGGAVACGVVFRGAPLANLTQAGCDAVAGLGLRTVIDLRQPAERAARPDADCVAQGAHVATAPMPIPYGLAAADYLADLHATDAVHAAFAALGDPAAYPIYFHCTYGRDRTGVLAALVLGVLGASRADVLAEYARSADVGLTIHPDSLGAVLDELERAGGAEAYLLSVGVTPDAIAALRARGRATPSPGRQGP